ncbi:MAG: PBP1A family penicillin-binding protein [Pseudomonadota bacterium]|nr:PBP1A family penicillin-binding protein [Pseudomonadota bacterium]
MSKLLICVWSFLVRVLIIITLFLAYLYFSLPNVSNLRYVSYQEPLEVLTREGQLIESFGKVHRIPITIDQVPHHLIQAILVTEDQRFYVHPGIDLIGIGRALRELLSTGEKRQGASTITMQVARNFFLGREKTYFRKINEILLALAIERSISKDEILELYFNKIYFGHRAYGIAAAARNYYDKTLAELSIAEMAMLAGLPKSPSRNNPIGNPKAAIARRDLILGKMLDKGVIDQQSYAKALVEPVVLKVEKKASQLYASGRYIADMTRQTLVKALGPKVYEEGIKVYTTVSADKQISAARALTEGLSQYDRKEGWHGQKRENLSGLYDHDQKAWRKKMWLEQVPNEISAAMVVDINGGVLLVDRLFDSACRYVSIENECWLSPNWCRGNTGRMDAEELGIKLGEVVYIKEGEDHLSITQIPRAQGALVALNAHSGEIEALVGGYHFGRSHFNRAIQAFRQPGSAIKPLFYAAAIEKGYTMATKVNDSPIVMEDIHGENDLWRPKNVDHVFKGPIRLRQALIQSRNLVSVRIVNDLGVDSVRGFLEGFGIDVSKQPQTLSMSLGSGLVSPLQLARAFTAFPNHGVVEPVSWISRVENSRGEAIMDEEAIRQAEKSMLPLETQSRSQSMSPETAYIMASGLRDVVRFGTGRLANSLNRNDIYGKTGTSNDQIDAWFSGFNADLVTTVWVGHDDKAAKSLKGVGARVALPIWTKFMGEVLPKEQRQIEEPDNIVRVRINRDTGLPVKGDLTNSMLEMFNKANLPSDEIVEKTQEASEEYEFSMRDDLF